MKNVYIFDNQGETFDRYTIILPNGDILGASCNPFHPQGFGQHCGNWLDPYQRNGEKRLSKTVARNIIFGFILKARKENNLGKEIYIKKLPAPVIEFINQNLNSLKHVKQPVNIE